MILTVYHSWRCCVCRTVLVFTVTLFFVQLQAKHVSDTNNTYCWSQTISSCQRQERWIVWYQGCIGPLCLSIYLCVCVFMCRQACVSISVCVCVIVCTLVHVFTWGYTHPCVCACLYMCAYTIPVCVSVCMHILVCVCTHVVCVRMCVCVCGIPEVRSTKLGLRYAAYSSIITGFEGIIIL